LPPARSFPLFEDGQHNTLSITPRFFFVSQQFETPANLREMKLER